ncbi:MAG: 3-deoxy-7-phosphoheptulonate synthase, partial [Bacteroidota bacterium]
MEESNYSESDFKPLALNTWLNDFSHPLIISGPCSAESYEQVMKTAEALHDTGMVSVFRSGIWKPRTRPSGFEGRGEEALKWIVEVKERYGFLTAVEVATPSHVEICLKHGIDMLWVGARTSVNPFSVQELADALRGVDIPVLVKNPVNPDLNLWIGV